MKRKQFTFYESFYRAMRKIKSKTARADIFDSICAYALYEEVPDDDVIHPVALAIFEMAKPVLDSAREKALAGGKKQTANKDETNQEQTDNTPQTKENQPPKEKEGEIEVEKETERESERACAGARERFECFWKEYPKKVDKKSAWAVFQGVEEDVQVLLDALRQQKRSAQWLDEDGRFIPRAAAWLRQRRWEDELPRSKRVPMGASGELGQAELDAIRRMMAE